MLRGLHFQLRTTAMGLAVATFAFGGSVSLAQDKCDTVKACAEQMVAMADALKQENALLMKRVLELESQLTEIRSANYVRTDKLAEEADRLGFVRFDTPLSIRDHNQPSVVVTRHGGGGNYLSPYPEGSGGLGAQGSTSWVLRRK